MLAMELPQDLMAHNALPLAGLRLDRSKRRFAAVTARGDPTPKAGQAVAEGRFDLFPQANDHKTDGLVQNDRDGPTR
jgi:hypothetical protein